MNEDLIVRKIENGTVIDHIAAGKGLKVINILGIDLKQDQLAVVLVNVPSKKLGKKDMIKIEKRELTEREVSKIALIAPEATLSIIRDWNIVEKKKIDLPDVLQGVVDCPNTNCITKDEKIIVSKFFVENKEPLKIRCNYCERVFSRDEIKI